MNQPRIVRVPEVCERIGVSRATLYYWIEQRRFPAPAHIGPNTRGWRAETVDNWINQRLNAGTGVAL